jgi:hypothetical protein
MRKHYEVGDRGGRPLVDRFPQEATELAGKVHGDARMNGTLLVEEALRISEREGPSIYTFHV